ncbi:MAG: glycosyltransferase [Alphaproteobacteria bacterium]|nr:glycosyltransferase [Alphaproteobacteria bacterium]
MKTALAIFVKTPHRSPVKTRLAQTIGAEKATEFFTLSIKAVEATARQTNTIPHWAVAEAQALDDDIWKAFPTMHTGDGCLGTRQHHIYETLLKSFDQVILIGADTPQLTPDIINDAVNALKDHDIVIGPANDGGYYLFSGKSSTPLSAWQNTPWSTSATRKELEKNLRENNICKHPHYLKHLTDIDTQEDLIALTSEMPSPPSAEQNAILNLHYTRPHQAHKTSNNADD